MTTSLIYGYAGRLWHLARRFKGIPGAGVVSLLARAPVPVVPPMILPRPPPVPPPTPVLKIRTEFPESWIFAEFEIGCVAFMYFVFNRCNFEGRMQNYLFIY